MGAQHTPGPWVIEDGWLQNERGPYADGQYLSVCMTATRWADLHLITAAPDMLAALEAARAQIIACHLTAGLTLDTAIRNIDPKIDAAIAKARGEAA